jgi:hypothetical protein
MRKIIGVAFFVTAALGCSGEAGESLGQEEEAIAGGLSLVAFHDGVQKWYFDTNGDGRWLSPGDFESAAGAFGGVGDIGLWGYGVETCGTYGGTLGVYRPSTREFFLDANEDRWWNGTAVDRYIPNFLPAAAGFTDQPIIWAVRFGGGDFPICRGVVGYFRTPNAGGQGVWYVDLNNNGVWDGSGIDGQYNWGWTGDIAVPLGSHRNSSRLTIYQPATGHWIKDDGDRVWEGCGVDSCLTFIAQPSGVSRYQPFGNPNGPIRGVSSGVARWLDLNDNGVWNPGAGDMRYSFASDQAFIY